MAGISKGIGSFGRPAAGTSKPRLPGLGGGGGGGMLAGPDMGGVPTPGGGGAAPAPTPAQAPPVPAAFGAPNALSNVGQTSPQLQRLDDQYQSRLKQLQAGEREPNAALTQGAIESSTSAIRDQAEGARLQLDDQAARAGRGAGFQGGATGALAQRLAAKAATDISMGRARDQEQMDFARGQNVNQFLLGGQGIAMAPSQLSLAERGLGLDQWRAQSQDQLARAGMAQGAMDREQQKQLAVLNYLTNAGRY